MSGGFDPEHLTPAASLNRVRIVELPGVAVGPDVPGQTGYALLSARALADLVRRAADALGLDDVCDAEPAVLLPRFDRCFVDGDADVRAAADAVARRFGRRLGYLILALRRGDEANRRARPDWDDGYWSHWASVRTIHLTGGVVSGRLGPRLVEHAAGTLDEAGMTDCAVRVSTWPTVLPLVGAARSAPPESEGAALFDFGHSFVKRGCAGYRDGTLTELRLLPGLPARWTTTPGFAEPTPEQVERLADFMVDVLTEAWQSIRALGHPLTRTLVVSVASYARDGRPLSRQGGVYAALATLSDNVAGWLSRRVSDRLARSVEVALLHDGTAAARAYAGEAHAAVMALGTSLGVGFPPPAARLRPVAPTFAVAEPESPPG